MPHRVQQQSCVRYHDPDEDDVVSGGSIWTFEHSLK